MYPGTGAPHRTRRGAEDADPLTDPPVPADAPPQLAGPPPEPRDRLCRGRTPQESDGRVVAQARGEPDVAFDDPEPQADDRPRRRKRQDVRSSRPAPVGVHRAA